MKKIVYILSVLYITAISCNRNNTGADSFGNFQAEEILVSAQTAGQVKAMYIEEGQKVEAGHLAAELDSTQYWLKVTELRARKEAIVAKRKTIIAQALVHEQQLKVLLKDIERVQNMLKDGAATQKQLDDINGQAEVVKKQIAAVNSGLYSLNIEVDAINAGIAQATDMLERTRIRVPVSGTILEKYIANGEIAAPGKPLFKMANLEYMELKAYISGGQLSSIALGQDVKIKIDGADDKLLEYTGKVTWISDQAEFTPKNIQTREERISQVYAMKVKVKNNGSIKINMPGEVYFK